MSPRHAGRPHPAAPPPPAPGGAEAGFSLFEMLISMTLFTILILGVLALFESSQRVGRVQGDVAEMQQSIRIAHDEIVRKARMAGRGNLPVGDLPNGVALAVRNNAGVGTTSRQIAIGSPEPQAVTGTDILTVRGIFESPLYQVAAPDFALAPDPQDGASAVSGTITLRPRTNTGFDQDLASMVETIERAKNATGELPEAILLVDAGSGFYGVVELDPGTSDVSAHKADPAQPVTVAFKVSGGTNTTEYQAISTGGTYPPSLTSIDYMGVLEEYRFYIRDTGGDPRLTQARMFPGTELPWGPDAQSRTRNVQLDIADDVEDLQVALGFDTSLEGQTTDDPDGVGTDDMIVELAGGGSDDWLYNGASDDDTHARWDDSSLYYLRLNTVARTSRRDPQFLAPTMNSLEDRTYASTAWPNRQEDRRYRRRLMRTVIDLRNL